MTTEQNTSAAIQGSGEQDSIETQDTSRAGECDYLGLQVFTQSHAEYLQEEGDIELAKIFSDLHSLACDAPKWLAALTAAESENARLREDSARIDFLDKVGGELTARAKERERYDMGKFHEWTGFDESHTGKTVRECIDAARAARATPPASGESLNK